MLPIPSLSDEGHHSLGLAGSGHVRLLHNAGTKQVCLAKRPLQVRGRVLIGRKKLGRDWGRCGNARGSSESVNGSNGQRAGVARQHLLSQAPRSR